MPGRKPHSRKSEKEKKEKRKKEKKKKEKEKSEKKRWQARPFGESTKKNLAGGQEKKGKRQLTARPGAGCPCEMGEKKRKAVKRCKGSDT